MVTASPRRVLAIVAAKTGYPQDMLDLELDLEADLGIDTVKQAETFAAIREAFGIPLQESLSLRDYPTLQSVVGFVYKFRPDLAESTNRFLRETWLSGDGDKFRPDLATEVTKVPEVGSGAGVAKPPRRQSPRSLCPLWQMRPRGRATRLRTRIAFRGVSRRRPCGRPWGCASRRASRSGPVRASS